MSNWKYLHFKNYLMYCRSSSTQESGFSLLESLVAVAVVSILIVSITPLVALSTSARVNARRVDQATQAARSYIDGVRGGVIDTSRFPNYLVPLPPPAQSQSQYLLNTDVLTSAQATELLSLDKPPTTPTEYLAQGIKVDANGDGFRSDDPQDLVIQPIRSGPRFSVEGASTSTELNQKGFWLAVRVYRASAFTGGATIRTGTEESCGASKIPFSSSTPTTCPIVTMRSQILPVDNLNNFKDLKDATGLNP